MARLHSIRIAGWKSIQDMSPPLELGSINVLIGANGSGKSNFVSFFKLMNELVNERLQTYIGRSGGANSVLAPWIEERHSNIVAELLIDTEAGRSRYSVLLVHSAPDSLLFTWARHWEFSTPGSLDPTQIVRLNADVIRNQV